LDVRKEQIGIVGLGQMGGGIARNLVKGGFAVLGYDRMPEAAQGFEKDGGNAAASIEEILEKCAVVLTCVEGKDSMRLADEVLLPSARKGQTFVDHSTVPVPETRRIGGAFLEKGAQYLDAPISGGKGGAAAGTLRMFIGGDRATADECWPLFEAAGNAEKLIYCGPIGYGQATKVVQQLTTRFPNVARLEVLAFGLKTGLDLATIRGALDIERDSNDPYARLCRAIETGDIARSSYEFAEWDYFLQAVRAEGFRMPMLEGMYEYCKNAEKTTADAAHRAEPSIWNELMRPGRDVKPEQTEEAE
jgi:3-hydroxyisobutyrate dehydrogenase-like beta-hydroxyacid dehydrogenase